MPAPDPNELVKLALEICIESACRAVVCAGWTELSSDKCNATLKDHVENGTILVLYI